MWWIFFHFFFLFLFLVFDHHKSFLSWKKWEPKALSCYSAGHKEELDEEPPSTFWSFSDMKGKIGEFTYCMSKYVSESERSTKWPVLLSRWHVSFEVQSHSWNCSEIFSMAKKRRQYRRDEYTTEAFFWSVWGNLVNNCVWKPIWSKGVSFVITVCAPHIFLNHANDVWAARTCAWNRLCTN